MNKEPRIKPKLSKTFAEDFLNGKIDPISLSIIIAVVVVIISIVLFWCLRRNQTLRKCILLIGLSEAGKTLLFARLISSKKPDSYTSMKENSESLVVGKSKKVMKLVDIPGSDRIRPKYIEEYKNMARAVIFVIDSLNFPRELRDVAELLFVILSDKTLIKTSPPVLILCNKQDETMAKSAKVVQSQLEKELNTLRLTRSAALDSTHDSSNNTIFLGRRSKDFAFSDLNLSVEFAECSAKEENEDISKLNQIRNWLNKL